MGKPATGAAARAKPGVGKSVVGTPSVGKSAAGARQGRPKTANRLKRIEAKHAAILDAALALFSRYGLHGTTVEEIARTAGVSKTNLFYYFASKEDVYVGVLSRLLDLWLEPLREFQLDSDPIEGIREFIRRKMLFSRAHPEASRLFCLEMVQGAPLLRGELETSLKALVDSKVPVIEAWVAAGKLAPVDPHHLIFALWATTQHYADFASQIDALLKTGLDDDRFVEEATRNVQRIVLDGLRVRNEG